MKPPSVRLIPGSGKAKKTALILGLMILALFFSGCERTSEPEGKRVVILLPQWFYPSEDRPWLQGVWEELRQAHPDVTLELQLSPGRTEQVLQKLLVARAAGDGPDLACIRMHWAGELLRHRILMPLQGCVPKQVWQETVSSLQTVVGHGGGHYVLPYDVGVRVILYRADLFKEAGIPEPEPGWSREEMLHAARALTRDRDHDGKTDQWGFGLPGARHEKTIFQWLPWFWSLGGRFGGDGNGPPSIRSLAAVQAMQWYRDLAWKERVTPPTFYSMDQATVFQGLAGGLFAMTEGGSWEPELLEAYSPHARQIRVAPLPAMKQEVPSVTLVDGWGFGLLTGDPEKKKVIGDVLAALSSPKHQLEKYKAARMLSPFQALYRDPVFLADPAAKVLAEAVQRARPVPVFPSFPRVQEALQASLQEILMNDAAPGTVLAAQEKRMAAWFEREADQDKVRHPRAGGPTPDPGLERLTGPEGAGEAPGFLSVVPQGDVPERVLSPEMLLGMERKPVGDLRLIPLVSFFPASVPGDLLVRAADGFEKRVPALGARGSFLDPESLYVYLVPEKGEGRVFTIRDVVRVSMEEGKETGGLVVSADGGRHVFQPAKLKTLAEQGLIPFSHLMEQAGFRVPPEGKVRLVADDGYTREVSADSFLSGTLRVDEMRCSFPGLSSKDQVSSLGRIEIP